MKLDRCYRTLGVTGTEDKSLIKKAFIKVALKYHPDKTQNDIESQDKFIEARNAYENIMKSKKGGI